MTNQKILLIIEKLSQLTVARGATVAEAAVAREKIVSLRAQLTQESQVTPSSSRIQWDLKEWEALRKPLSPSQMKEWDELLKYIHRKTR